MLLDPIVPARDLGAFRDVVVLDCRPDLRAYDAGHLLGAHHAQLERGLAGVTQDPAHGGRHPLPRAQTFCEQLGNWGVTPTSHVLAYDDQGGANAAARLWWMLRALGHDRVHVVEGGLSALIAAGHQLTQYPPTLKPAAPYPARDFAGRVADIDEVDRARTDQKRRVLDVRAAPRYRGESEPIDPVAGHIPGAHSLPFSENLREDGTFKSAEELRALYGKALDGVETEDVIVHCGSGVTACHTLLALERAALPGAKLYVGSWSEWCRNSERPREPT